jgi:hypothetical protein
MRSIQRFLCKFSLFSENFETNWENLFFSVIIVSQQKFTTFEISIFFFLKRKRVHAMIFIQTLLSFNYNYSSYDLIKFLKK